MSYLFPTLGRASGVLARLATANLNSTADQAFTMLWTPTKYLVRKIVATNASATPTLAAGGVYTTTAKGGSKLVETTQLYTGLSAAGKYSDLTLLTIATTDILTSTQLYLSLTTANGSAATADFYIIGDILEP